MELTIRELASTATDAVLAANVRAADRRVTDLPDERTIRWYATIGLLDRPSGNRGRTALYGERHVLQLVAIKRLQAAGHSLAEIQERLVGATDRTLRRVAGIDGTVAPAGGAIAPVAATAGAAAATARRFWREAPMQRSAEPTTILTGLDLGNGVVLMLPGQPDPSDVDAIRAAAQPLLDLLAQRQLSRRSPS